MRTQDNILKHINFIVKKELEVMFQNPPFFPFENRVSHSKMVDIRLLPKYLNCSK